MEPAIRYRERYHTKRINNARYPHLAAAALATARYHRVLVRYRSALDLGSSVGALLAELEKRQAWERLAGVDYGEHITANWQPRNAEYHEINLDAPVTAALGRFELIISQEVAEHLLNPFHLIALTRACAGLNSVLIFSGAYPGQRGKHHVSCKWHSEWRQMIEEDGIWQYDHQMTAHYLYAVGRANAAGIVVSECYLNTMIFQRPHNMNLIKGNNRL